MTTEAGRLQEFRAGEPGGPATTAHPRRRRPTTPASPYAATTPGAGTTVPDHEHVIRSSIVATSGPPTSVYAPRARRPDARGIPRDERTAARSGAPSSNARVRPPTATRSKRVRTPIARRSSPFLAISSPPDGRRGRLGELGIHGRAKRTGPCIRATSDPGVRTDPSRNSARSELASPSWATTFARLPR